MIVSTSRFAFLLGILFVLSPKLVSAQELDSKKLLSEPKAYVGSDVCKTCHLEHYDAWKRTLHSKMLQDVSKNEDVLVTDLDQEVMKADFKKIEKKLKVPLEEVYFPKREDVEYTIGSQWKQRYLVKKDGTYYIAPTQFNIDTGRWVNYCKPTCFSAIPL